MDIVEFAQEPGGVRGNVERQDTGSEACAEIERGPQGLGPRAALSDHVRDNRR